MTHTSEQTIRVELKYCERCGGLWFRRENTDERFCLPCTIEPALNILRHCERPIETPNRKPSVRADSPWYGPMSATVERLQGVAGGAA